MNATNLTDGPRILVLIDALRQVIFDCDLNYVDVEQAATILIALNANGNNEYQMGYDEGDADGSFDNCTYGQPSED